jgi:hypothetical protein
MLFAKIPAMKGNERLQSRKGGESHGKQQGKQIKCQFRGWNEWE